MPPTRLAERLRKLREARGLSGRRFAAACGLSREAIRKFESGVAIPTNQTIFKIFNGLGLNPKESEEAREVLSALYYSRLEKTTPKTRSYGVSANEEIRAYFTSGESISEQKIGEVVNVLFEQIGDDQRTESLEHYLKTKIRRILEN